MYFDQNQYLLGSNQSTEINLFAGVHTYPFEFILPKEIPSTFKGKFGYVRYTIKAALKFKRKFEQEVEIEFIVITNVDLDRIPGSKVGFNQVFDF